jgi:hypothetical protein
MRKTLVLGDTHGRSNWKLAIHKQEPLDRVIFMGDYFDSFEFSGVEQIDNFKQIIQYKENNPKVEVVLLIGNHDHHYYPGVDDSGTSGYQTLLAPSIKHIVGDNKQYLQAAYQVGEFVFTHAGLSSEWLDDSIEGWNADNVVEKVNELFQYQPGKIAYRSYKQVGDQVYGAQGYGNEAFQGPIWIRPSALMTANKKTLRKKIIQVVGHTPQDNIDIEGKATGGRYYFIDTMPREYLIVKDGVVSLGKLENEKTKTT